MLNATGSHVSGRGTATSQTSKSEVFIAMNNSWRNSSLRLMSMNMGDRHVWLTEEEEVGREGDLQNEMTETDNSLIEQTWMDRDMIVADLFYTNSHVIICWSGLRVVMEDTNSVLEVVISVVVAAKSTAYTPGESCRAQVCHTAVSQSTVDSQRFLLDLHPLCLLLLVLSISLWLQIVWLV